MSKRMIKVEVRADTGYVNATHRNYWELPEEWDEWSENAKEVYLNECARNYQDRGLKSVECVESYAEVVTEDEMRGEDYE